jgi:signal transduction histidine kinase/CheY-like chemotaxis protein
MVVVLGAAMVVFPEPWIPFLSLVVVLFSGLLVANAEFITAAVAAALTAALTCTGARSYYVAATLVSLGFAAGLGWLIIRTVYTALDWAWTMQQRADRLLERSRDHQGELGRALHSLDKTNWILRRTQQELIIARQQADEARRMKEQFAANVSHELRTPLNIIIGFSQMMVRSPELYGMETWTPSLRDDIEQIYTSSQHLLDMINDVLDLSRFEMVGFTLHREPTEIRALLDKTMAIVSDLFRDRSVTLEVDVRPDLPPLEIDRTRIRQVMLNLLNNAARYAEDGIVRVAAERANGELIISVSDTGPGIPAAELPHLFQEFYQVDGSLRRPHAGAGLGLAISKHFVEAHDGRIWVESKEGQGSTFSFSLPIAGQHVPVARLERSRPLEAIAPPDAPILVVDADPSVADLVRRYLEIRDVTQVVDQEQLEEEIRRHHPQAVVRNRPPGQDWTEISPLDVPIPVPVIDCSLPSQTWLADKLAVSACLTKPVSSDQILQEIQRQGDVHDILIVDDDRGFCQLVARVLEGVGQGYHLRQAYGGAEALRALRESPPDLLLLDLLMPGIDGFQVLDLLQEDGNLSSIPVVLVTATSYVEDALQQIRSPIVVQRSDGLGPAEVLRCLRLLTDAIEPHYDERFVPAKA